MAIRGFDAAHEKPRIAITGLLNSLFQIFMFLGEQKSLKGV